MACNGLLTPPRKLPLSPQKDNTLVLKVLPPPPPSPQTFKLLLVLKRFTPAFDLKQI